MTRRLDIRVDHDRCVGNAMCVSTAPGVFAHNANRQSEPVDPTGGSEEQVLEAAAHCPVSAITVVDADNGEPLFPPPRTNDT